MSHIFLVFLIHTFLFSMIKAHLLICILWVLLVYFFQTFPLCGVSLQDYTPTFLQIAVSICIYLDHSGLCFKHFPCVICFFCQSVCWIFMSTMLIHAKTNRKWPPHAFLWETKAKWPPSLILIAVFMKMAAGHSIRHLI